MKLTYLTLVFLVFGFSSCSNPDLEQAVSSSCELVDSYKAYKQNPDDGEKVWAVTTAKKSIDQSLELANATYEDLKDAMKNSDCKDDLDILEEALEFKE